MQGQVIAYYSWTDDLLAVFSCVMAAGMEVITVSDYLVYSYLQRKTVFILFNFFFSVNEML